MNILKQILKEEIKSIFNEDFKSLPPNTKIKYKSYPNGTIDQYIYVNDEYAGGVMYRSNGIISLAKIENDYRGLNLYPNALFDYVRTYKKPAISKLYERNKNSENIWNKIKNDLPADMQLVYENGNYILSLKNNHK